jgi:hypothetical protein
MMRSTLPLITAIITLAFSIAIPGQALGDNSETDTEQALDQKNVCSGDAECINQGSNLIGAADSDVFTACIECFEEFLTPQQISQLEANFDIEQNCARGEISYDALTFILRFGIPIADAQTVQALLQCLEDAGVVDISPTR